MIILYERLPERLVEPCDRLGDQHHAEAGHPQHVELLVFKGLFRGDVLGQRLRFLLLRFGGSSTLRICGHLSRRRRNFVDG